MQTRSVIEVDTWASLLGERGGGVASRRENDCINIGKFVNFIS